MYVRKALLKDFQFTFAACNINNGSEAFSTQESLSVYKIIEDMGLLLSMACCFLSSLITVGNTQTFFTKMG